MKMIVVYLSKTGFSEYYANLIATECSISFMPLNKCNVENLNDYDVIIYGGGVYAGAINGYKKFLHIYNKLKNKKLVLYAVGAMPNNNYLTIEKMWRSNLKEEQLKTIKHFYMQGGIAYEKLGFFSKRLMKTVALAMYKKNPKIDLRESFSVADIELARPIITYLGGNK